MTIDITFDVFPDDYPEHDLTSIHVTTIESQQIQDLEHIVSLYDQWRLTNDPSRLNVLRQTIAEYEDDYDTILGVEL